VETSKKIWLVGGIVIIILGLVALFLYKMFYVYEDEQIPIATDDSSGGLGADIYSEVNAEGQGSVPAPSPVPNPVGGLYKNPFE